MSFQFSQNLLADIQSPSPSSPKSNSSLTTSQPASLTQNCDTQNYSQSQNLLAGQSQNYSQSQNQNYSQSQNLLAGQSQNYPTYPSFHNFSQPSVNQFSQPPSRYQSQLSFSKPPSQYQSQSQASSQLAVRTPVSRFNSSPDTINLELAKTLKSVQSGLDDFPVLISRMLEEGLDHLGDHFSKESQESMGKVSAANKTMEDVLQKVREKDEKVKKASENVLKMMTEIMEMVHRSKENQKKYEEIIAELRNIVEKQSNIIKQLKREKEALIASNKDETSATVGQIKVKSLESLSGPAPRSESVRKFSSSTPRRLTSPISSTPSSSESVRKFCLTSVITDEDLEDSDDDIVLFEEESDMSLDMITFNDLITVDSDSEEDCMLEE